jgi:hypothetical protein
MHNILGASVLIVVIVLLVAATEPSQRFSHIRSAIQILRHIGRQPLPEDLVISNLDCEDCSLGMVFNNLLAFPKSLM